MKTVRWNLANLASKKRAVFAKTKKKLYISDCNMPDFGRLSMRYAA